jgi:predicted Zn-dependent protease
MNSLRKISSGHHTHLPAQAGGAGRMLMRYTLSSLSLLLLGPGTGLILSGSVRQISAFVGEKMNNVLRSLRHHGGPAARGDDYGANHMMRYALSLLCLLLLASGVNLILPGCAGNLATGERHLNLVSESQEIAIGQEADAQIIASLGLYPDSALQRYVQELGSRLAQNSERPNLPWTFRVVDDPTVNAFALPGGFIYATRGLMAYMMNEAELSSVIGHEIGHVTAQHSVHRMSEQQLTQIAMAGGMMIKPELERYSDLINTGLGLLYLKYSRADETQADHLGLRYMIRAGYDPREMIDVFDMLGRVSQAGGTGRLPEWLATHPNPENRSERIQDEIDTLAINLGALAVNQNGYLRLLEGVVFGPDPRQGFFRENHFYHPELEFEFLFPSNWPTANLRAGVVAISADEDAIMQITIAQAASAAEAAQAFFQQDGLQGERQEATSINGLSTVSARFRAQDGEQALRGRATFVDLEGHTYQLLGYTMEQSWSKYESITTNALQSFRRLTDPVILRMQPMRLTVLTVNQRVSLEQLAQQESSPVLLETLALINQTEVNAQFNAGDRVKMVLGEELISQTTY